VTDSWAKAASEFRRDRNRNDQPRVVKGGHLPPFSEEAIALRFAERYADNLRFVAAWAKWLTYDAGRWRIDETGLALDRARALCRQVAQEAKARIAPGIASARTAGNVLTLARADRRLAADSGQWDRDPWLLNTPAGVVDLRTGDIRPHESEDFLTRMTAVAPRGDCPRFLAFLRKIMGEDEELVAYLQRVFGYCLSGDTSEQAIFFNYGAGQNGKSVLMGTVSGILGDYALATPIETFTETKTDRHPTELARMRGARLVTATETEAGKHWAESRLKELTGGERIAARFMHKDFFEFTPQFKPLISGNHRPRLRSVGLAMRRRVNMIPFAVKISDDERDDRLAEKLKDEWPGILQWKIDGCLAWQEQGLAPPEAVVRATDAYFAGEDGYSDWIADRCDVMAGFWSRSSELFSSWRDWAEKAGQHAGDNKRFREEMERLGFTHRHLKTGSHFVGLRIRQDPIKGDPEDQF
jgi:putative DNA primase/helicase